GASATSPGAAPTGAGSATAHSNSGQPATVLGGVWGSGRSTTDAAPACSRSAARWSAPPGPATTTAATGRPTERAPSTVSSAWLATSAPPGATTTTVAPRRRAASRTRPSPSRTGASSPGAERTVTPSGAWRSSARTRSRMSNPCVVETSSNSGTRRRLPAGRRSAGSSAALEQRQPVRVDELGDRGRVAEVAVLAGQHVAPSPGDAAQHGGARRPHEHHGEHLAAAQVRADARPGVDGVIGAGERLGPARTEVERAPDEEQLHRVVRRRGAATQDVEGDAARGPVHRPAVVRVDEAERLKLVALVDVGDARRGELQEQLAERAAAPRLRDPRGERREVVEERPVVEQRHGEALDPLLPV